MLSEDPKPFSRLNTTNATNPTESYSLRSVPHASDTLGATKIKLNLFFIFLIAHDQWRNH